MSASSTAALPPFISSAEQPLRFEQVIRAIGQTTKLLVLCSESATRDSKLASIEDLVEVRRGTEIRRVTLAKLLSECLPKHCAPEAIDCRKLAGLNRHMALRRVHARNTDPTALHKFLARRSRTHGLVGCLTTSVDGLEARGDQILEEKTLMLCGNNRELVCCRPGCVGLDGDRAAAVDEQLIKGASVEMGDQEQLGLQCDSCRRKWVKTAVAKRAHGERTLLLRPAVQLELSIDAQEGQMRQDALSMARRSQLLLILEQPLKERTLSDLAQALADEVHQHSGAVLYISRERLRTRGAYNYIDLQLDLNSQELVNLVNAAEEMQGQPQDPAGPDMFCDAADLWLEILRNEVPIMQSLEDIHIQGQYCHFCNCSISEYLIGCQNCDATYCHRRFSYDESPDAVFDDKGTIVPQDLPGDDVIAMTDLDATPAAKDDFPMEEACVILDYYSPDGRRPRLSEAKKRFLCPECWQAKAGGLYPHFVRPSPRLHPELEGAPTPKLAVVIYYVEQFWPHATHLASMLTGRWTTKSWKVTSIYLFSDLSSGGGPDLQGMTMKRVRTGEPGEMANAGDYHGRGDSGDSGRVDRTSSHSQRGLKIPDAQDQGSLDGLSAIGMRVLDAWLKYRPSTRVRTHTPTSDDRATISILIQA
ncbi:Hydrocephalus-inducing protein [Ceratobasidium sp. AG-Ba]|nr:Hydrocephalus-inducing protein [Ceratobasidium sp. AG-Ba]